MSTVDGFRLARRRLTIGTTQLAPGFPISDIFKMILNITPFVHT